MGFRNEFDGHTLTPALEQVRKLTGKESKTVSVDRVTAGIHRLGSPRFRSPNHSMIRNKPNTNRRSSQKHIEKEQHRTHNRTFKNRS